MINCLDKWKGTKVTGAIINMNGTRTIRFIQKMSDYNVMTLREQKYKSVSSQDFGSNSSNHLWKLEQACASVQSCQTIHCLQTLSLK